MTTINGQTPDPDCPKCQRMAAKRYPTPVCPAHWVSETSVRTSTCDCCGHTGPGVWLTCQPCKADGIAKTRAAMKPADPSKTSDRWDGHRWLTN